MKTTIAYIRVSTKKQNPKRQYDNIASYAADNGLTVNKYYEDKFTGKEFSRPEFDKLRARVDREIEKGNDVTIIFDSVSRMSRTAEDGIKQYFDWYDRNVNLVFLHEMAINTEAYNNGINNFNGIKSDDKKVNLTMQFVRDLVKMIATEQIEKAFEQAEKEGRDIKSRVVEGLNASDKKGGRPAPKDGERIETNKAREAKAFILKKSKRYNGTLNDTDTMKLAGISRPSFYKYLREIEDDRANERAKAELEKLGA